MKSIIDTVFFKSKSHHNHSTESRKRGGFTMAELLIVVAIMIILFGFAFAGIVNFIRNLNQTELDKTAEVIYVAAQNRMSEIYASGEAYKLTAAASGQGGMAGVAIVQNAPKDWDDTVSGSYPSTPEKKLCMIASSSTAAAEYLFPENSIIAEEWRLDNWIVEYDPDSLMVYSVFFSKKLEPDDFYKDEATLRPVDAVGARRSYGATVGYYGGPVAALNHEQVKTIYCQVKAEEFNKEKLLAQIVVGNIPPITVGGMGVSTDIDLVITVAGESSGNQVVLARTLTGADSDITDKTKRVCYLILDGLENGEHFKEQFCSTESLYSTKNGVKGDVYTVVTADTTGALIPGENVTIKVEAKPRNPYVSSPTPSEDTTNSLFASLDSEGGAIKAEVAYGRHLQNLDSAISGFDAASIGEIAGSSTAKVNVFQIPNQEGRDAIDFSKHAPEYATPSVNETSDITERIKFYYATYLDREFRSVINPNVESYNGQKNKIIGANVIANDQVSGSKNAGLFGEFSGSSFKDMYIVNERIKGYDDNTGATGGIAGTTNNAVTIEGCMNYLKQDIDDLWDADNTTASNSDWVKGGTYVGGLIGDAKGTVSITKSMASSVIKTSINMTGNPVNYVGGLIGRSAGAVTIEQSYTDSYLSGEQIAGMVANAMAPVNINESYVAGFALQQDATDASEGKYYKTAAAFVSGSGTANLSNSYSVFDFDDPTPDILKPGINDHTTRCIAENEGSLNAVFYTFSDGYDTHPSTAVNTKVVMKQDLRDAVSAEADANISEDARLVRGLFRDIFVLSTANNSYPYNLTKDFYLTVYPYPSLELRHYGDWTLYDIEPGSLVYFERYTNGQGLSFYRFSGSGRSYLLSHEELKVRGLYVDLDGYALAFPMEGSDAYQKNAYVRYDENAYVPGVGEGTGEFDLELRPNDPSNFNSEVVISGKPMTFQLRPIPYYMDNDFKKGIQSIAKEGRYYVPLTVVNDSGRTSKYYFNPHFASTVLEVSDYEKDAIIGVANNHVSVRTARQLFLLSLYYPEYKVPTRLVTFKQELDIDYDLYKFEDIKTFNGYPLLMYRDDANHICQPSIGYSGVTRTYTDFTATYDGGCRIITNVGINYDGLNNMIGLFRRVEQGAVVRNVVYANNYSKDNYYSLTRSKEATFNGGTYYLGMLAGVNAGTIANCAVTGQVFNGAIYNSCQLFVGGLVGSNNGTIERSSADIPCITARINGSSYADLGAFAGHNSGTIRQSFANGRINIPDSDGKGSQNISGFVGDNVGRIEDSYCSTTKQISKVSPLSCFGFASNNGSTSGCLYLNDDAYYYVDGLYAYSDANSRAATSIHGPQLKTRSISGFGSSTDSAFHNNTSAHNALSVNYPYPTSVRDDKGFPVYYGEWPVEETYGDFGFYYWEKEEGGANSGYHFYLMTNENGNDGKPQIKNTLCTAHNDGGYVTSYGYGYYAEKSKDSMICEDHTTLVWENINPGVENEEANQNLEASIGEGKYKFHSFTTVSSRVDSANDHNDRMYLCTVGVETATRKYVSNSDNSDSGITTWGSVTIGKQELPGEGESIKPITYYFSPFFAASMVRSDESDDSKSLVGTQGHKFQIRSADQLQFINWNNKSDRRNTRIWLNNGYFSKNNGEASATKLNQTAISFPYLGYAYAEGTNTKVHHHANFYFNQTHDLDADMDKNATAEKDLFTPIGSLYDSNHAAYSDNNSYVYTNYFNGDYNGNSYAIKNIQIYSNTQSVGLFGITIGAHIEHLILYSEKDNIIATSNSDKAFGWYNLGGVVGMSLKGGDAISKVSSKVGFDSCAVAGYRIQDNRRGEGHGYGGANIGGFSGLSNINFSGCSAVTDILVNQNYGPWRGNRNVRTGGFVGNFRGENMQNCYSGGTASRTLYDGSAYVNVHFGGLVGGHFMRTAGNMQSMFGTLTGKPTISRCYSYMVPIGIERRGSEDVNQLVSNGNNEGNGEFAIDHCYYYNPYRYTYGNSSNATYSSKITATACYEITYKELSGQIPLKEGDFKDYDIYCALNNLKEPDSYGPWYLITNYENPEGNDRDHGGYLVNGKFSFPGSDKELDKKNYPFPTVVTQTDAYGDTVHVHYGTWPKANGIFLSTSEAALDLVADNNKNVDVNISFYPETGAMDDLVISKIAVSKLGGGDCEFIKTPTADDIKEATDTLYNKKYAILTLHAKKIGAETLVITYTDAVGTIHTAELAIRVTAEVLASAEPVDMRAKGEYGYLEDYDPGDGNLFTGLDLSHDPYEKHKTVWYRLLVTDMNGKEIKMSDHTGSNWILTSDEREICDVVQDSGTVEGEKVYYLKVLGYKAGTTNVNYQFDTNIKTGIGEETAKSGNLSITITVLDVPKYNLDKDPVTEDQGISTQSLDDLSLDDLDETENNSEQLPPDKIPGENPTVEGIPNVSETPANQENPVPSDLPGNIDSNPTTPVDENQEEQATQ